MEESTPYVFVIIGICREQDREQVRYYWISSRAVGAAVQPQDRSLFVAGSLPRSACRNNISFGLFSFTHQAGPGKLN